MIKEGPEIMIVTGETSGDRLGAELVEELKSKRTGMLFFGTTGPAMRSAGVESVFDSDAWSVVGIGAVARSLPRFLKILSRLRDIADQRRPTVIVLIDFPEFNLKLATKLKKDGHRVIYYVSPQVWAWRKYRVGTIRKNVDLLLSILPFEKGWYAEQGIEHVEFVGNPIVARTKPTRSKKEFFEAYGLDSGKQLIALLPGSRRKEIARHLPLMMEAANVLKTEYRTIQVAVAAANSQASADIEKLLPGFPGSVLVEGDAVNLLNAADAAAISSGTATLEAGIVGAPMVVVYKLPRLDYALFRPVIKTPHIALINLVAGRRVVTELVQNEFTPERLSRELKNLLEPTENARMRGELEQAVRKLNADDSKVNAAEAVIRFLDRSGSRENQS